MIREHVLLEAPTDEVEAGLPALGDRRGTRVLYDAAKVRAFGSDAECQM